MRLVVLRFASCLRAAPVAAQQSASVTGRVLVEAGVPLADVRVVLSGSAAAVEHVAVTNAAGRYAATGLAAGRYSVQAEALD